MLLVRYNTPEIYFPCREERKRGIVRKIRSRLQKEGAELSAIGNIRV